MSKPPALTFTDRGIYCAAGDFYIDPWKPVARALITHGHADHARWGHDSYLCTDIAAPVMRHRLGAINIETIPYGAHRQIGDAVVSFHPAGHVPGSAQIRVEVAGEIWVASGDYKAGGRRAVHPVRACAVSSFHHRKHLWIARIPLAATSGGFAAQINTWWAACRDAGQTAFLGAYALGKAQRLLSIARP